MNFEAKISFPSANLPDIEAFAAATQGAGKWKAYPGLNNCYLYCEGVSYSLIEAKLKSTLSALTILGLRDRHGRIALIMFDTYTESSRIITTEPVEVVEV